MLRAAHVRGTMSALSPNWRHLSPAIGLALSGSHLVGRLHELDPPLADKEHSAACLLTKQLFHRDHRDAPLHPTTNRSLAAAHLSPSLTAHVAGIASSGLVGNGAHEALRKATCSDTGMQLAALARETGVTIARFERLVEQVQQADSSSASSVIGIRRLGSALLMHHLWLRASLQGQKRALWTYLETLQVCLGPVLTDEAASLLGSGQQLDDGSAAWSQEELAPAQVVRAANFLLSGSSGVTDAATVADDERQVASAFELVAAATAQASSRSPPLLQGRYGFRGQPPVADCAELVTRELLNQLLWCEASQSFDVSRLPHTADCALLRFYAAGGLAQLEQHDAAEQRLALSPAPHATQSVRVAGRSVAEWFEAPPSYSPASQAWFELLSGRQNVSYLKGDGRKGDGRKGDGEQRSSLRYEMAPTLDNVIACLGELLGQPGMASPADLEALWARLQPERDVRLRVSDDGTRLFMLEPYAAAAGVSNGNSSTASEETAALRVTLELVMSPDLNHAFAVHNWAPLPWQGEVAAIALTSMVRRAFGEGWVSESPGEHDDESLARLPQPLPLMHGALMPALMQPLLSLDTLPASMSTNPRDGSAIGFSVLRLVSALSGSREAPALYRYSERDTASDINIIVTKKKTYPPRASL